MTLREHQASFALDFFRFQVFIYQKKYTFTYGEMLRTVDQQAIYVKTGRSKTMLSDHLQKCAGDINIFTETGKMLTTYDELRVFGEYWESLSPLNRWGGHWRKPKELRAKGENWFKDLPHYERHVK